MEIEAPVDGLLPSSMSDDSSSSDDDEELLRGPHKSSLPGP